VLAYGRPRTSRSPREAIDPIDPGGTFPREVIQAHVLEGDFLRGDIQKSCDLTLEPDRGVAEADRPVTLVSNACMNDADRVW